MKTVEQRFEKFYIPVPESGCWLWVGGADPQGYGIFSVEGRSVRAHRFSYEFYVGAITNEQHVLHKCDVPACVNPQHLFLGDSSINAIDAFQKGRRTSPSYLAAKLSRDDVEHIRSSTERPTVLARQYGVTYRHIRKIKTGERWR